MNSISVLYRRMKSEDKNSGDQLMALSCTHDWLNVYNHDNGHTKYFFNVLENWQAL